MSDDVNEIKSRIDIVDLISGYVKLKRAGKNFLGLCPFHTEKTPSFSVSPEKQSYYCFGCGKSGDIFSFVMETEGLGFKEALAYLAERTGVTLSSSWEGAAAASGKKDIRSALEAARDFFGSSLEGPGGLPARAYLTRRNLSPQDASRFSLGWSPPSWDALSKCLLSKSFDGRTAIDAGLVVQGERGVYDRFRGRVMFPVNDENGRIVAFGGRLIDGEGAKYINSPEGPLYNKRRTLYLMDSAKRSIRERKRAILVEGYMDAIRAHMRGFTETVASLGTSLTDEQAALIKRFTDLCYISYDADGAGQAASIRGMYLLERHGLDVRVVVLPENLDPDDLLSREDGEHAFEAALKKALPLPLHHVHMRKRDLRTPGAARAAREEILSGLASLPALDIEEHIPNIARGFGILEHELRGEISARRAGHSPRSGKNENPADADFGEGVRRVSSTHIDERGKSRDRKGLDLECAFCSLLWRDERLRSKWECGELVPYFSDEAALGIVAALVSGDAPRELESRWYAMGERLCFERIARGDAVADAAGLSSEFAEKVLDDIRMRAAWRRYEELKPIYIRGEASPQETAEYHEAAKKLKIRRRMS
ncbi:MAG: DNA primase [Synergistaceae bacterium]|jgi:DNA primase|nr:DNA primase [Synergistaceae bacterium]